MSLRTTFTPALFAFSLALLPMTACNNPAVKQEAREAADASKAAARETGEAVGTAGKAAGDAAADASERAKRAAADGSITTAVKAKLIADPEVKALQIDVDTTNGIVTLSGVVDSAGQKAEAEKLTRQTDGVVGVMNQLRIK